MSFEPQTLTTYREASLIALWIETLLFGIYAVLFGICVYIFRCRKHSQSMVLMIAAVLIFALSTAHLVTVFISTYLSVLRPQYGMAPEGVALASGMIYITNNIVADGLIVYRCYMVWGSRKRVIILPSILLLATAVLGYTFRITIQLIVLSLATSITATGLTAGRIWWIACQTKKHLGHQFAKRYSTACSIVIESGLIYSLSLVVFLAVYSKGPGSNSGPSKVYPSKYAPITTFPYYFPASYIVYAAVSQIMGIVSTLIVVRVGLGLSTENGRSFPDASSHRFAAAIGLDPPHVVPAVNVEFSTIVISSPPDSRSSTLSRMSADEPSPELVRSGKPIVNSPADPVK
ncbi:hypothetical protein HGRIS_009882 [Hohenbuehelia grisea]|uniref:Integral membrane protein n=1 Tax=Hohenbuehelia grisea TaxID=104357 RepID=A0ABR3J2G7_9AGAR